MQCAAFENPKIHAEPTRREMVFHNLNPCKTDANPLLDLAWCLLRSRGVSPVPNGADILDQINQFLVSIQPQHLPVKI